MAEDYDGMTLAGYLLSVATLNNLRSVGIFNDDQIQAIYDDALLALETVQAISGGHSPAVEVARRLIDQEIERESSTRSDQAKL